MSETRKLVAILVADVVGYSRLDGADEDRTLARLRALRSDLIYPTIAVHHGRIVIARKKPGALPARLSTVSRHPVSNGGAVLHSISEPCRSAAQSGLV
jgi:hypothetical protein